MFYIHHMKNLVPFCRSCSKKPGFIGGNTRTSMEENPHNLNSSRLCMHWWRNEAMVVWKSVGPYIWTKFLIACPNYLCWIRILSSSCSWDLLQCSLYRETHEEFINIGGNIINFVSSIINMKDLSRIPIACEMSRRFEVSRCLWKHSL